MVSSTYFDLADARATLEKFLEDLGHEPLLHESPGFGVTPGKHSHVACLDQVDNADYVVLIVGGRRGGVFVESLRSITSEEYKRAMQRKIPIFTFVKRDVDAASQLYKSNPRGDFSKVVDHVGIFDFLDVIKSASQDNWVRQFDTVQDIIDGLRGQFAYLHTLYSKQHVRSQTRPASGSPKGDEDPLVPFPSDFTALTEDMSNEEASAAIGGLKRVHATLREMRERKVQSYGEKVKVLWLLGLYGEIIGSNLAINESSFKQYAWGASKGKRVLDQLRDFGINGRYERVDEGDDSSHVDLEIGFDDDEVDAIYALRNYANDLAEKYGKDDGLEFFGRGDMTIYGSGSDPDKLWSRRSRKVKKKAPGKLKPR